MFKYHFSLCLWMDRWRGKGGKLTTKNWLMCLFSFASHKILSWVSKSRRGEPQPQVCAFPHSFKYFRMECPPFPLISPSHLSPWVRRRVFDKTKTERLCEHNSLSKLRRGSQSIVRETFPHRVDVLLWRTQKMQGCKCQQLCHLQFGGQEECLEPGRPFSILLG